MHACMDRWGWLGAGVWSHGVLRSAVGNISLEQISYKYHHGHHQHGSLATDKVAGQLGTQD